MSSLKQKQKSLRLVGRVMPYRNIYISFSKLLEKFNIYLQNCYSPLYTHVLN